MSEGECAAVRPPYHGLVELDAGCLQFLGEIVEIFYVEPDVIEDPPLGWNSWRIGLCERQVCARNVGRLVASAHARRRAEVLCVPRLDRRNGRFGDIEVHVMVL